MGTTMILVELLARHQEDASSEEQQRVADEIMDRLRGIQIAGVESSISVNVTTLHRTHMQTASMPRVDEPRFEESNAFRAWDRDRFDHIFRPKSESPTQPPTTDKKKNAEP